MPKLACVQVPELLQTLSTVASVVPDVLRICIWIWSYVIVSGQCGWYQNVSCDVPVGTAIVCVRVLLPLYAVEAPSCAAYVPPCADVVTTCGTSTPLALQLLKSPVSNPPLATPGAGVAVRPSGVGCVALLPVPVVVVVELVAVVGV